MWKLRHQLDFHAHKTTEGHVLDEDWNVLSDKAFADTNGKDNFRIHFTFQLSCSQVGYIVRNKREPPVHKNDILFGFWVCFDMLDARRLGAEGEFAQAKRIEECRRLR